MGSGHTCRESSNPRNKGNCDCGKKVKVKAVIVPAEGWSEYMDKNADDLYEADMKIEGEEGAYARARDIELSGGNAQEDAKMRKFDTGATRDTDTDKLDYEGFLSPSVLRAFAGYMHKNRIQADGSLRDSDNWQKGIPIDEYMKSMFRHFMEVWTLHREQDKDGHVEFDTFICEALCALLFNVQGYLHEVLKDG